MALHCGAVNYAATSAAGIPKDHQVHNLLYFLSNSLLMQLGEKAEALPLRTHGGDLEEDPFSFGPALVIVTHCKQTSK